MTDRQRLAMIMTEYDRKQSNKQSYNRYALAQYLMSIDAVMLAVYDGLPLW